MPTREEDEEDTRNALNVSANYILVVMDSGEWTSKERERGALISDHLSLVSGKRAIELDTVKWDYSASMVARGGG